MMGIEPPTFFLLCCASCYESSYNWKTLVNSINTDLISVLQPQTICDATAHPPPLTPHTHLLPRPHVCWEGERGRKGSTVFTTLLSHSPHHSSLLTSPETIIATLRHLVFNGGGQAGGQGNHRAVNICAHSLHQCEITNREVNERCPNEGSTLVPNGPVSFYLLSLYGISKVHAPHPRPPNPPGHTTAHVSDSRWRQCTQLCQEVGAPGVVCRA